MERKLGFWALLALVIGNMVGSGIYVLPAQLAPLGWNQFAGWGITIIGALALAQVFSALGRKLPLAGGPYAYATAAFGPLAGFTTAWAYWVMSWVGNAAVAVAVVSALALIWPVLGETQGLPAVLAVACVWTVTLINIRGVREAGRLQEVTVVLKLLPLVGLIGIAVYLFATGAPRAPDPGVPFTVDNIALAAGLTFWGFLGLEAATVPADKVENPGRNIARATMLGVALTGLVYFGISAAFALYMPIDEAAASPAPIASYLGRYLGGDVAIAVALFAAISAFGTLNGWVLVQAEMPWAMAKGGVFPAWFAQEGRHGTPVRSHLVSSGLLSGITLLNYQKGMTDLFGFIASVSLAAGLVAYLMAALAALKLARGQALTVLAALVAVAFFFWAEYGLGTEAMLYAALLIGAGLPVYLSVRTATAS
ncbi:amino acid permease [Novosphingobium sp.]|jgi:APA family basic amino acid/polyamine antiporter|uniref:amino acid permease n=1 Tax=Novosphingobium sp. TaxID=1874826 RepID=UPI0022BFE5E2|nr:amino acid permease [Novosphingobium sp.]MCZ8018222.1 amino acid permease [Novosphingobium sp.]MCZ8033216.1 amino acid permease [Novosphingobium sp.]MCZ8051671.1 amino acid permease [Novosphingobium sp.]MCZ8060213.1 amino acid permease [Novosphingobium sp.]MCZ8231855.1 amino acid permease [Novosphingobium sp.]